MTRFSLLFILFFTFSTTCVSQTQKFQLTFETFKNQYNAQEYDSIYASFSTEMQNTLPVENTKQFLIGLQLQAGKIKNAEVQKMQTENSAVFKTTFENGVFEIHFAVDAGYKIAGLLVQPYVAPSISTVENQLSKYPSKIADLIYTHVKDFPENTQLSIAVLENGKTKYYGVQIKEDKLVSINNQDKVFEIGSLTKILTSTVLANLVTEGQLKLDDKINAYYPFLFNKNIQLTFESLANHTSGLPRLPTNMDVTNAENPYQSFGTRELEDYLANHMVLAEAEKHSYDYSNTAVGVLGHTLGLSQKISFDKLLEKLFKKYKMKQSFTNSTHLGSELVKGLNEEGQVVSNWGLDALLGAGGVLSTANDMVLFANAQFNLDNKTFALMRKETAEVNKNMKIGLGWHLLKSKKGNDLNWHNGATAGYSSSMVLDVKNKNGIIILSNVSGYSSKTQNIDALAFNLLKLIE